MAILGKNQMKIGSVYRIHHIRKGTFIGQLIDVTATQEGDEQDDMFLKFKYDVRAGTAQVGMAIAPGKDAYRISDLRPSLITKVEELKGENWLRDVKVPEEEERGTTDDSLLKQLSGLFK